MRKHAPDKTHGAPIGEDTSPELATRFGSVNRVVFATACGNLSCCVPGASRELGIDANRPLNHMRAAGCRHTKRRQSNCRLSMSTN